MGLLADGKDEVWDGFDQVLDPKMTWTVPGRTCVTGTHRGLDAINNDFFGKCWREHQDGWTLVDPHIIHAYGYSSYSRDGSCR